MQPPIEFAERMQSIFMPPLGSLGVAAVFMLQTNQAQLWFFSQFFARCLLDLGSLAPPGPQELFRPQLTVEASQEDRERT